MRNTGLPSCGLTYTVKYPVEAFVMLTVAPAGALITAGACAGAPVGLADNGRLGQEMGPIDGLLTPEMNFHMGQDVVPSNHLSGAASKRREQTFLLSLPASRCPYALVFPGQCARALSNGAIRSMAPRCHSGSAQVKPRISGEIHN